jgi:hypothetical protein
MRQSYIKMKHLICSGRKIETLYNDARGEWNGAKKVMRCSKLEWLLSGDNALVAELCSIAYRILTGVVEAPYTTQTREISWSGVRAFQQCELAVTAR